ncbi:hypothetical protein M408DRAFT_333703 [Serendipita vermifera MAFF 305830]|uniref:SCP domain-containing protein n=1 Tax=Serendipita vermifera MAFF 305830 TaxID=933852 RepID=A0A0C3ALX3_SERVB|nr:hypothetical protein M408DRAFT_333703 [Serendipita vermifera MAFF 305830]
MHFNLSTVLTILVAAATPLVQALPNAAAGNRAVEARALPPHDGVIGNVLNARQMRRSHPSLGRVARKQNRRKTRTRNCPAPTSSASEIAAPSSDNAPSTPTTTTDAPAESPAPESPAPTQDPSSSQEETPAPETPAPAPSSDAPSNSDPAIQEYLNAHNNERANHGAAALTWADDLAQTAQAWANGCVFQHSGGPTGENLSAGSGSGMTPAGAIQLWLDEAPDYNPSSPQYSHWTQVVWKNTKEVGCAVASCSSQSIFGTSAYGTASFYVCEYRPAGNVIGQFAANVQA